MRLYEPVIPMRYAGPLLELVREQSPDQVERLSAECGINLPNLVGRRELLTMAEFDRLLCATSELLGSDIGFELGQRIDIDSHEALSVAIRHCPTVHVMMTMIARYWRLITTSFAVTYRRHDEVAEWIVRPAAGMSGPALIAMEEVFAMSFYTDYVRLIGTGRGLEIHLSIPLPPHSARYEARSPARFHFDTGGLPEVRCVLPAAVVDSPMPHVAAGVTWTPAIDRAIGGTQMPITTRCGGWVALMLREADGIQPSREVLAELLGVSPRTLSRNLETEGIDLRQLANAIRFERACAMLLDSTRSVTEIAFRLGYRDVASFTHAFKRCSGKSPRLYRKAELH